MDRVIYRSAAEIVEVVAKFENCAYRPEEFSHARHLTVASWYVAKYGTEQALPRMREGLQGFLAHHGKKMGYHETITRFWLELIGEALQRMAKQPLPAQVNEIVARYRDKNVLFVYYTRELVMSEAARNSWIEPDLRSICVSAERS